MLYLYSGYDGFLTAVFRAYEAKDTADASFGRIGSNASLPLADYELIKPDKSKADRVEAKLSALGLRKILYRAWLFGADSIDSAVFESIRESISVGKSVMDRMYEPHVKKVADAARRVGWEIERYLQFVRFVCAPGDPQIYVADIEPQYDILPLIANHFFQRFGDQRFVIRDAVHGYALVSDSKRCIYSSLPAIMSAPLPSEGDFAEMWRKYFRCVAIPWRRNLKLQQHFIPKRYRAKMTEFN